MIDRQNGAVISELLALRSQGEAIMALCRRLEARGLRTPYGNATWNPTSVRNMLSNRVYLGEARSGAFVKRGAHPPLVDAVTFQQAQAPREIAARKGSEPSLLGGLVRCAACSLAMRAFTVALPDGRRRRYYSCARRCAGGSCEALASMAGSLLEPLVEQCFFEQLARRRPRADRAGVAAAEQRVAQAEAALERYCDNDRIAICRRGDGPAELPVRGCLGAVPQRFDPARCPRATLVPSGAQRPWSGPRVRAELEAFLAGRTEWHSWDAFHAAGRGRLHDQVVLQGGTRLWARRLRVDHSPVPTIKRGWSEERIRATLALYLKDPTPEEFRADGFGQLRAAITSRGGIDPWVAEFGLPAPHRLRGPRVWWNGERIEAELRRFAAGREVFPTVREFRRAGQTGLLSALRRHGGVECWAARVGLPRRERYSGRISTTV